jgi:hypothetical protein
VKRPSGTADEMEWYAFNQRTDAIRGSEKAIARVQGMKARAELEPPTQIDLSQRFPYPGHRTCAEWR